MHDSKVFQDKDWKLIKANWDLREKSEHLQELVAVVAITAHVHKLLLNLNACPQSNWIFSAFVCSVTAGQKCAGFEDKKGSSELLFAFVPRMGTILELFHPLIRQILENKK